MLVTIILSFGSINALIPIMIIIILIAAAAGLTRGYSILGTFGVASALGIAGSIGGSARKGSVLGRKPSGISHDKPAFLQRGAIYGKLEANASLKAQKELLEDAHKSAVDQGLKPGSEEYNKYILLYADGANIADRAGISDPNVRKRFAKRYAELMSKANTPHEIDKAKQILAKEFNIGAVPIAARQELANVKRQMEGLEAGVVNEKTKFVNLSIGSHEIKVPITGNLKGGANYVIRHQIRLQQKEQSLEKEINGYMLLYAYVLGQTGKEAGTKVNSYSLAERIQKTKDKLEKTEKNLKGTPGKPERPNRYLNAVGALTAQLQAYNNIVNASEELRTALEQGADTREAAKHLLSYIGEPTSQFAMLLAVAKDIAHKAKVGAEAIKEGKPFSTIDFDEQIKNSQVIKFKSVASTSDVADMISEL